MFRNKNRIPETTDLRAYDQARAFQGHARFVRQHVEARNPYGIHPDLVKPDKRTKERGPRRSVVKPVLAALALAGTIAGGVKTVQTIEHTVAHNHAVAAANAAAAQRQMAPGIKEMMVSEDKAILSDAKQNPGAGYVSMPVTGQKGVYEVISPYQNGTQNTVYMGMKNGLPDPNKPMYVDMFNYSGGGLQQGGEIQLAAPAGDAIANQQGDFSGAVDGWAARADGGMSDSQNSSLDGGFTLDTTNPGLSAGYDQANPTPESVAGSIKDLFTPV